MSARGPLTLREAVRAVREGRRDGDVVVSSMSNAREWMAQGPLHPRDLVLVPSAMGHATSLALGIALAQPQRRVIVLSGDGSLLMSLGSLVTTAACAPTNLTVVVFDNGVYEVTGAQPTPATVARLRGDAPDFATMARGCGIRSVITCGNVEAWRGVLESTAASGPHVVVLGVAPVTGEPGPRSPGPTGARAAAFMRALSE